MIFLLHHTREIEIQCQPSNGFDFLPQSTSRNYSQPIATSTHCINTSTSDISSVLSAANMRQRWRQHQCRRRINSSIPRVLCNNIGQGNIDGHGSCAIICTINQYTVTIRSIEIQWIYNLLIYEWCKIDHIMINIQLIDIRLIYNRSMYDWYMIDIQLIDTTDDRCAIDNVSSQLIIW